MANVFITGATGYMGSRLIPRLLSGGHRVTALAREASRSRVPTGCSVAIGNALDGDSYGHLIGDSDTFVQLVGVAHPGPAKAQEFVEVDMKSGLEAVRVARATGVRQFVYVSVAHPAPMMQAYIDARRRVEFAIQESGMDATILRPWYVTGPDHRWPYLLLPFYKLAEALPATREGARRLGLVTLPQMVGTLAHSVEIPATGIRVLGVSEIRTLGAL